MPKAIQIILQVNDPQLHSDVKEEAEHLLLAEHPWLPGGFFREVKVLSVDELEVPNA